MEKTKNSKKGVIIAVVALVLVIAVAAGIYFMRRPSTQPGTKNITVEVKVSDDDIREYKIKTTQDYLRGALEQENLISGEDSEYGLFIKTVDGVTADESANQWWGIFKGENMTDTSVDTTPIADGESYRLVLMSTW